MKSSTAISFVCLILGIGFFFFGTRDIVQINSFVANAELAQGKVVEMKEGPSKFYPRVRFQTTDGSTFEFTSSNGSNPPLYMVDQEVPVLYSESNPNYAYINSFIEIWLGPIIYAMVGLFFLVVFGILKIKAKLPSS